MDWKLILCMQKKDNQIFLYLEIPFRFNSFAIFLKKENNLIMYYCIFSIIGHTTSISYIRCIKRDKNIRDKSVRRYTLAKLAYLQHL